ncbi:hypothetical protein AWB67_03526 [Caballeronia terrestris]|uniref:Uncharacterized protein n=1 Tax=Caballeronia terrestris TaxID=1226301 RepID=A0A158J959_9BURK|nr:hypothetical protein AWB67_03526 [Caballeronia terrestris]
MYFRRLRCRCCNRHACPASLRRDGDCNLRAGLLPVGRASREHPFTQRGTDENRNEESSHAGPAAERRPPGHAAGEAKRLGSAAAENATASAAGTDTSHAASVSVFSDAERLLTGSSEGRRVAANSRTGHPARGRNRPGSSFRNTSKRSAGRSAKRYDVGCAGTQAFAHAVCRLKCCVENATWKSATADERKRGRSADPRAAGRATQSGFNERRRAPSARGRQNAGGRQIKCDARQPVLA